MIQPLISVCFTATLITALLIFPLGIGPVILNYYPSNNQSDHTEEKPLLVSVHNSIIIIKVVFSVGIMQHPIHLSAWLAAKSCRLFVGRPDRYHYLVLLGVEPDEEQNLETISSHCDDDIEEKTTTKAIDCVSTCDDENND